jgi:hypothetical protein
VQTGSAGVVPSTTVRCAHAAIIRRDGDSAEYGRAVACVWRTIGSTLAVKAFAASRFVATPFGCAVGDQGALFFGKGRVNVDHERVGVRAKHGDDEGHVGPFKPDMKAT